MARALALLAAFCYASSHVASKRGLVTASVPAAVLTSLFAATVVSGAAAILAPPRDINPATIPVFAAAGLVAPGFARWASTMGVYHLGPSTSVPIAQGTNPLIATLGGIMLFGEPLTSVKLVGVLAVASGSVILTTRRSPLASDLLTDQHTTRQKLRPALKPGIIFPFLAAISYAVAALLAKSVLSEPRDAPLGTAVSMGTALLAWTLAGLRVTRLREQMVLGDGLRWLILSGGLTGSATLFLYGALNYGEVSIVSPITASQSLIVLLLSRAILRDLEDLPLATIFAGALVAFGTAILLF